MAMDDIMANSTTTYDVPPLPSYTLTPRPEMIQGVSDVWVTVLAPVVAYWVVSLFFHFLDTYDFFAQYRLHTPAEVLKRNHVSRYEVLRDVILQQVIQTIAGYIAGQFDPPEMLGKESYDIAVWAQRLRWVELQIPTVMAVFGVDASKLAVKLGGKLPIVASILAGGQYPNSEFTTWEMNVAKFVYWVGVPLIQFMVAIVIVDTWQYFLHRGMHMNKFLYTTLHARHHRLYVPYAYGALYNHPVEGFVLDTLGAGIAYTVTGMSVRQGLWFFTCSTIKTVDDHCGYAFPWDPLQHFTSNNAAYHDVHHQSWGIKTNFSQPFSTFWDRLLGTAWTGGDVSARYERDRIRAQKKVDAEQSSKQDTITNSAPINATVAQKQVEASRQQFVDTAIDNPQQILAEELREEQEAQRTIRRPTRRRQSGFDPKSLSDKVSGSLYGRGTPILHADGVH